MKPIFLIGFMGSGKTTLGKAVANATGLRFVDLDEMIERQQGMSVCEIFDIKGEREFRRLESDTLAQISGSEDMIVACGGGTPCYGDNMAVMLASGTTVWLNASVERLVTRLAVAREQRPLLARLDDEALREFVIARLTEREPFYSRAEIEIDSSFLDTVAELEDSVAKFCKMMKL